jgi:L-lactate utilization protein LutB
VEARLSREDRNTLRRQASLADVFLTGSNAVTLDGKLVNTDATGNRVSAMIWGPKKTILVAGANKIVQDVDEALGNCSVSG